MSEITGYGVPDYNINKSVVHSASQSSGANETKSAEQTQKEGSKAINTVQYETTAPKRKAAAAAGTSGAGGASGAFGASGASGASGWDDIRARFEKAHEEWKENVDKLKKELEELKKQRDAAKEAFDEYKQQALDELHEAGYKEPSCYGSAKPDIHAFEYRAMSDEQRNKYNNLSNNLSDLNKAIYDLQNKITDEYGKEPKVSDFY